MAGNASFVSARRAFYSPTPIAGNVFPAATEIGRVAPGSSFPETTINTSEGFGLKVATNATKDITLVVYGGEVDAALEAAAQANPPPVGFLYIVNASGTRADEYACNVVSADTNDVEDEPTRERSKYMFYCDGDVPSDFHQVIKAAVTVTA